MDQSIKRCKLAEKWRSAEFEGRTHLGPKAPSPMPKTMSHFATKAEWEAHRKAVAEAQRGGAPF